MTPIEISDAPNMYVVEFEVDGHLRFSVILAAACSLAAMLAAWERFPDYKRLTTTTSVRNVHSVAIDWKTGFTIVAKEQENQIIPPFLAEEPNRVLNNDWHIAEEKGK